MGLDIVGSGLMYVRSVAAESNIRLFAHVMRKENNGRYRES